MAKDNCLSVFFFRSYPPPWIKSRNKNVYCKIGSRILRKADCQYGLGQNEATVSNLFSNRFLCFFLHINFTNMNSNAFWTGVWFPFCSFPSWLKALDISLCFEVTSIHFSFFIFFFHYRRGSNPIFLKRIASKGTSKFGSQNYSEPKPSKKPLNKLLKKLAFSMWKFYQGIIFAAYNSIHLQLQSKKN